MDHRIAMLLPVFFGLGACAFLQMPNGNAPASRESQSSPPSYGSAGEPAASSPSQSEARPASYNAPEASAPAAPSTVSVDIHSDCPKDVNVFYGKDPGFGSGTFSSVESNSVESHTFNSGDMFWIVDDSRNGVSSVTVTPGMSEIDIADDCSHFSTR